MKTKLLLILLFVSVSSFSQSSQSLKQLEKARNYYDRYQFEKALIIFEEVARKWSIYDKNYPYLCKVTADCAYEASNYAKSIEWYNAAIKYGEKFDQNDKDDNIALLASSYHLSGDFRNASKTYLDAIKSSISMSSNFKNYVYQYVDSTEAAKSDTQGIIDILTELNGRISDPQEKMKVYVRLGNLTYSLSRMHEAKEFFEKACSIEPQVEVLKNLQFIYHQLVADYSKSAKLLDNSIKDYQIKKDNFLILSDKCTAYCIFYCEQAFLMNPQDTSIKRILIKNYSDFKENEKLIYLNNNTLYSFLKSNLYFNQLNFSQRLGNAPSSLVDLYYSTKDAIVRIESYNSEGLGSQGSGFIVSQNGICISNSHVFGNSTPFRSLVIINNKKYKIEQVLEKNEKADYIIFKIQDYFSPIKTRIATNVPMIGEEVYAIGNPLGLDNTVSKGIISGYRDDNNLLQTTTNITFGSSGGALFNMKGEVVGITSSGFESGNINFAINIQTLNLSRFLN